MGLIVVGIDGSPASHGALRWAVAEARQRRARVEAVFVSSSSSVTFAAMPSSGMATEEYVARALKHAQHTVDEAVMSVTDADTVEVTARVETGPPARELLEAASSADLLVLGARGTGGFGALLLGSVSHQCVTHAACPTVVVRPSGTNVRRIVVGVDGSEPATRALRWAVEEARLHRAHLEAVMAYTYLDQHHPRGAPGFDPRYSHQDAQAALEQFLQDGRTNGQVAPSVTATVVNDLPAAALLSTATDRADLLVVGTRGLGGFRGLLFGSVSLQCVQHAPVPVAVVP